MKYVIKRINIKLIDKKWGELPFETLSVDTFCAID
jgi:hypothetical protein